MTGMSQTTAATYRWPALLALLTLLGLSVALFGDGLWDTVSWVLLVIPLGVLMYCVRPGPRTTPARKA